MSSTDVAQLLASLRDIHEPAAPDAAWPWVLIGLALALLLIVILWKIRPKPARTVVQQQIDAARQEPVDQALVRLARLLRKHAQQSSTEGTNAIPNAKKSTSTTKKTRAAHNASGDNWLALLDARFDTQFFTSDAGQIFGDALYKKRESDIDIDNLCDHLQTLFDSNKVGLR